MRKCDKIKLLEKELGRYQKKVDDQGKVIASQHKSIMLTQRGAAEIQRGVDAIIAQAALTFGTDVADEETGEHIGKRLVLPAFSVDDTLARYDIHARKDEATQAYIVGVVPKEKMGSPAGPSAAVPAGEGGTQERARPAACGGARDAEGVTTP